MDPEMIEERPDRPPLDVYLLGLVDFEDYLLLQRRLVYERGEQGGGVLVLCEHPSTISVGRSGSRRHILADDLQLKEAGIPMRWVCRGGGLNFHLPGQLAVNLILPLDGLGLDLQAYLDRLEGAALGLLDEFDLRGETHPDASGVFLGYSRVAAVGVAVHRWISSFGLTLNVGFDTEPLDLVLDEPGPGGFRLRQTTMEARRQRPTPMAKVREAVVRHVESALELSPGHLFTTHPLLRREVRARAFVPSLG